MRVHASVRILLDDVNQRSRNALDRIHLVHLHHHRVGLRRRYLSSVCCVLSVSVRLFTHVHVEGHDVSAARKLLALWFDREIIQRHLPRTNKVFCETKTENCGMRGVLPNKKRSVVKQTGIAKHFLQSRGDIYRGGNKRISTVLADVVEVERIVLNDLGHRGDVYALLPPSQNTLQHDSIRVSEGLAVAFTEQKCGQFG